MKTNGTIVALAIAGIIGGALLAFGGRSPDAVKPDDRAEPASVVIRQKDAPDVATVKANILYLREQVSEFRELADRAAEFPDSGSAADWMQKRSARGHTEAFKTWHGWLFGFFGEGKSYDPKDVKRWASQMADGLERAVDALTPLVAN